MKKKFKLSNINSKLTKTIKTLYLIQQQPNIPTTNKLKPQIQKYNKKLFII